MGVGVGVAPLLSRPHPSFAERQTWTEPSIEGVLSLRPSPPEVRDLLPAVVDTFHSHPV